MGRDMIWYTTTDQRGNLQRPVAGRSTTVPRAGFDHIDKYQPLPWSSCVVRVDGFLARRLPESSRANRSPDLWVFPLPTKRPAKSGRFVLAWPSVRFEFRLAKLWLGGSRRHVGVRLRRTPAGVGISNPSMACLISGCSLDAGLVRISPSALTLRSGPYVVTVHSAQPHTSTQDRRCPRA